MIKEVGMASFYTIYTRGEVFPEAMGNESAIEDDYIPMATKLGYIVYFLQIYAVFFL